MSEVETTLPIAAVDQDAELLAIPPRADDLGEALAAKPPRARPSRLTVSLGAAVLVCAGFLGGVLTEKHSAGSGTGRGAGGFSFAGAGNRAGRGGGFGAGAAASGGAISGTITVVSGDTLFVTAADGSVYTVKTTGTTTVSIAQNGTVSQLKAGQKVTVNVPSGTINLKIKAVR